MTDTEWMKKRFPRKVVPHPFLIARGSRISHLHYLEVFIADCPACGNQVKMSARCPRCGQALDWEDGE